MKSLQLIFWTGFYGAVLSLLYLVPYAIAQEQPFTLVSESKNKNMDAPNTRTLDSVTKEFLTAIDDAEALYDSKNFSTSDEIVVRTRLREAFEVYFATIIPLENKQGQNVTERSREVIQEAIAEFMEFDSTLDRSTEIALDLDAYSTVMTESLIHTATAV